MRLPSFVLCPPRQSCFHFTTRRQTLKFAALHLLSIGASAEALFQASGHLVHPRAMLPLETLEPSQDGLGGSSFGDVRRAGGSTRCDAANQHPAMAGRLSLVRASNRNTPQSCVGRVMGRVCLSGAYIIVVWEGRLARMALHFVVGFSSSLVNS